MQRKCYCVIQSISRGIYWQSGSEVLGEINNTAPTDQRATRHRPGNISHGRVAFAHLLCRKSETDTDSAYTECYTKYTVAIYYVNQNNCA